MKFFIVSLALVAAVAADVAHLQHESTAQIVRSESNVQPDGYSYAYETTNGIYGQEQGALKAIGPDVGISVQGSFGYTSPDGTPIQLTYIADENGFQPQGAHLPTPPPTPEHVLRTLQLIAAAPQQQQYVANAYQAYPQAQAQIIRRF